MKVITPRGRKPIMVEDHAHSEPWRKRIKAAIMTQCPGVVFAGPVSVGATFVFEKLGPSAQVLSWPVVNAGVNASGDLDKLTRNLLDAMQDAGLIMDDCMVIELRVIKIWATEHVKPGIVVAVEDR